MNLNKLSHGSDKHCNDENLPVALGSHLKILGGRGRSPWESLHASWVWKIYIHTEKLLAQGALLPC